MARTHTSGLSATFEFYDDDLKLAHTHTATYSTIRIVDRVRNGLHREITTELYAADDADKLAQLIDANPPTSADPGDGCSSHATSARVFFDTAAAGLIEASDRIVLTKGVPKTYAHGVVGYEAKRVVILPPSAAPLLQPGQTKPNAFRSLFEEITAEMQSVVQANNQRNLKSAADPQLMNAPPARCTDPEF